MATEFMQCAIRRFWTIGNTWPGAIAAPARDAVRSSRSPVVLGLDIGCHAARNWPAVPIRTSSPMKRAACRSRCSDTAPSRDVPIAAAERRSVAARRVTANDRTSVAASIRLGFHDLGDATFSLARRHPNSTIVTVGRSRRARLQPRRFGPLHAHRPSDGVLAKRRRVNP